MNKMAAGSIVYFKRCKDTSGPQGKFVEFAGHAFGVLLGTVPLELPDPPKILIQRTIGTIGYLTFDDVAEFLGHEQGAECVRKYEEKYYGKIPRGPDAPAESVEPAQPSKLVSITGKPLQTEH